MTISNTSTISFEISWMQNEIITRENVSIACPAASSDVPARKNPSKYWMGRAREKRILREDCRLAVLLRKACVEAGASSRG